MRLIAGSNKFSLEGIASTDIVTIAPDASVVDAARLMQDEHVGMLVITDKGKLTGIITDRDISMLVANGLDYLDMNVKDAMNRWTVTADEGDGLYDILKTMSKNGIRRIPITRNGNEIVGIITLDDILKSLGQEMAQIGSAIHWEMQREKGFKKLSLAGKR